MAYSNYNRSVGTVEYTNIANSFNKDAGFGAAFGSQFGGFGSLIGAAIGGAVGILGAKLGNRQADKTFRELSKVADLANQATLQELARNIGEVNRQRTISAMETISALQYTQGTANKESASSSAMFAQADQIGNQLVYVQSAIKDQQQEQKYMTEFNFQTSMQNMNQQVISLSNQAQNMFTGVNVAGGEFSWQQAMDDVFSSLGAMDTGAFKGKGGSTGGKSGSSGSAPIMSSDGNGWYTYQGGHKYSSKLGLT